MRFKHLTIFELLAALESSTRELENLEARRKELAVEAADRSPGVTISQIAQAAGVTRPTIYDWMKDGGSTRPVNKR